MALHIKRNSPLRVTKIAGAFIAIAAFLVQPLTVISFQTAFAVANPQYYVSTDGSDTNCDGTANVADVDTTSTACAKATVQAGINAAGSNATVNIGDGIFSASQYLVLAGHEGLTIDGQGKTNTTLELTSLSDGFKVQANNVTLKDFTIDGTSVANYGLRAQGVDNITVDNVKATKMKKTGFDINGVTNSSFIDLTAVDNGGNGFSVTDTQNLTFTNTRSSGNAWGGMGIYTHGGAFTGRCGVDGISFSGIMNLQEVTALYTGIDSTTCTTISNLNVPGASLPYKVTLNNSDPQDIYTSTQANAESLVSSLSALSPVVTSTATGHYIVVGGQTIQSVINAAPAGSVIEVPAGTYAENVNVNKAVTLQGNSASDTFIVGTNANTTPLTYSTNNATVSGFTITHSYTAEELTNWNFNNNGVQFGQLTTGNTLKDSIVSKNRNGVYINNAQGNKLIGNTITDNRTGLNMTNAVGSTEITGNTISDNWTIGLVMYSNSYATDLSTLVLTGNTFDQNWYTEVLVKDGIHMTGALDLTDNIFTDTPVTFSTSASTDLNEPGFADQKPVGYGDGTATKPVQELPTLRIYNTANASIAYSSDDLNVSDGSIVMTNDDVVATVPQDAVITPADPGSWDGVVAAPHTVTSGVSLPIGTELGVAIELGSSDTALTLSKAVKLVFAGEAGKRIGWQAPGSSTFTEITTNCSVYADVDSDMPAGGDCKTVEGSDLVVWTKHLTTFATYAVDTTKPTGSFAAPTIGSTHKGLINISAAASDSESGLKNLQIVLRSDSTNAVVGNWSYNTQTSTANTIAGTGTISFSGDPASGTLTVQNVNTAAFATGKYNLRLFTTDVAGNGNSAIYGNFFVDNSAPDGSIIAFSGEQKGDTTVTVNLSEVGTAGLGQQQLVMRDTNGAVAGNWSYNVKTGASNTIAGPSASFNYVGDEAGGQLEVTFDSAALDNGTYSLRLFTKDQLANGRSNIYGSVSFDNMVPGVTFVNPAQGATVRDLTISASLDGTGSNIKQYGFDVSGPGGLHFSTRNYQVDESPVAINDLDLCAVQYYGDDCPTELVDGTYTIRAKAYDQAGNRNISTTLTLTVDTTEPVVNAGDDQDISGLSTTLNGTSDDASSSYAWTLVSGPGTVTFTDPGAATTGISASTYGTYVFQLEATDTVGNNTTDTVEVVFSQPVVPTPGGGSGSSPLSPVAPLATPSAGSPSAQLFSVVANTGTTPTEGAVADDNGEVLGTSTTEPKKTIAAVQTSSEGWKIFGLAWYWWLAILAALAAIWWAFSAWRRRADDTL